MSIRSRLLRRFTDWALSKNAPGTYVGEDDPRWAYTITTDGKPYLTRVLLSRWLGLRRFVDVGIYLHHFHRDDGDQPLHNHPWEWAASLVLSGAYVEERLDQVVETVPSYSTKCGQQCDLPECVVSGTVRQILTDTRLVRFFNRLTKADYHRVRELKGDVWTLFITGPRVSDWGFLVDGEHVPWAKYLGKES